MHPICFGSQFVYSLKPGTSGQSVLGFVPSDQQAACDKELRKLLGTAQRYAKSHTEGRGKHLYRFDVGFDVNPETHLPQLVYSVSKTFGPDALAPFLQRKVDLLTQGQTYHWKQTVQTTTPTLVYGLKKKVDEILIPMIQLIWNMQRVQNIPEWPLN